MNRRIAISMFGAMALFATSAFSKNPMVGGKEMFPTKMVTKHAAEINSAAFLLTSDQWGDYMIYRFYPKVRVFFDGRSDFYGPVLGKDYISLMQASYDWEQVLKKHDFTAAFIPPNWPLASILKRHSDWKVVEDDGEAILFVKRYK